MSKEFSVKCLVGTIVTKKFKMVLTKSDLLQIKETLKIDELNKSILALSTTFTSSVTNLESSNTTSVSFLQSSINDKLSILETKVDANIHSLEANF